MFKLNPSEKNILEVKSTPSLNEKVRSRYLWILGVAFAVIALFYRYASGQDYILTAVFIGSVVGSVVAFLAYFIVMNNAKKLDNKTTYYITNFRVVEVDEDNKIVRELLKNKIKRVDIEHISRNSGDVIINPREVDPRTRYKRELKGERDNLYSKDTFILKSVSDVDKVAALLK